MILLEEPIGAVIIPQLRTGVYLISQLDQRWASTADPVPKVFLLLDGIWCFLSIPSLSQNTEDGTSVHAWALSATSHVMSVLPGGG